jgi:membrane protein YdbS with pleckstrin-like domain
MFKKWYTENFSEFNRTQKIIKALWLLLIPTFILSCIYHFAIKSYGYAFIDAVVALVNYGLYVADRISRRYMKEEKEREERLKQFRI